MDEVEPVEPPPAEPIAEPEKKKPAKKDDAPKPKAVRRKKVDEQPVVDVQPSVVAPPRRRLLPAARKNTAGPRARRQAKTTL